jgi:non-heme chloroperoxidase
VGRPIADAALLAVKLVPGAELKVHEGAPHGRCSTVKDRVNADLLAFLKQPARATAGAAR